MRTRINFTHSGRGDYRAPQYAMADLDFERPSRAVARAIGRASGLTALAVHDAGCDIDNDTITYAFRTTLARPARGGGWTPVAEVHFYLTRER